MGATQQQLDRLHAVVPAAQFTAVQYGVPASITLAQWICESSWGVSSLTVKANNCFGVKHSQKNLTEPYVEFPTAEFENGKRVMIEAEFVKYVSCADSFKAHAKLLATLPRYASAMAVKSDPAAFAVQIQKDGYSTNPGYAKLLMELVRNYNLTQYDTPTPTPADTSAAAPEALKEAA